MEEYLPIAILRPYIKVYRIIESQGELLNRVIPDTSLAIAFRLKGKIAYLNNSDKSLLPVATLSGLRKSFRHIHYAPLSSALIILFKETGAFTFFKQPLHELFEESVSLDNFFSHWEITIIEEKLAETTNNKIKIAVIEQFLCSKLVYTKPERLLLEAIGKIHATNGLMRIRELANELYISQDAFEKRFRKVTGTTPKQFSSIVRMKAIIDQTSSSFLDLALENGYYDQSHFNKDFKVFTGQAPTAFFKSASYW